MGPARRCITRARLERRRHDKQKRSRGNVSGRRFRRAADHGQRQADALGLLAERAPPRIDPAPRASATRSWSTSTRRCWPTRMRPVSRSSTTARTSLRKRPSVWPATRARVMRTIRMAGILEVGARTRTIPPACGARCIIAIAVPLPGCGYGSAGHHIPLGSRSPRRSRTSPCSVGVIIAPSRGGLPGRATARRRAEIPSPRRPASCRKPACLRPQRSRRNATARHEEPRLDVHARTSMPGCSESG